MIVENIDIVDRLVLLIAREPNVLQDLSHRRAGRNLKELFGHDPTDRVFRIFHQAADLLSVFCLDDL